MVGPITYGSVTQAASTQQVEKNKVQPVATAGLEETPAPGDLVFNAGKGKFSDNQAFAVVAEASAEPRQQHSGEASDSYTPGKYAKTAFDLFSTGRTGAQRQLQALLTAQTLQSLVGFSETATTVPETQTTETAPDNGAAIEEDGDSGAARTDESSGGTADTGGDTGGDTGTGDSTGGTTGPGNGNGNGNGHGYGKGGIKNN